MTVEDLHDTSGCPVGALCESCGTNGPRLAAVTATTKQGVVCLTLCPRCGSSGQAPPMASTTVAKFVATHAGHLGITIEDMAAVMEAAR